MLDQWLQKEFNDDIMMYSGQISKHNSLAFTQTWFLFHCLYNSTIYRRLFPFLQVIIVIFSLLVFLRMIYKPDNDLCNITFDNDVFIKKR